MAHRVIVVDPIAGSLGETAGLIARAGHIVVDRCGSYEAAVEVVSTYRPGVVVLALLPDRIPGLQILQNLRSLHPRLPIVVVSPVQPDQATVRFCKEQSVSDFLIQPFSFDRILSSLNAIKESEEAHQRGIVVCVGFTPASPVRLMVSQLQLAYLYYPSCHLAIQCFRQNRNTRLVCLIVQKDLDMYSNMLRQRENVLAETDFSPWKRVVMEAQLAYQDFWKEAIQEGYLPQLVPCLYLPRNAKYPWLLPADVMESLRVELIYSRKDFKQIVPSKIASAEGTFEIYQEMVKEVNNRLDVVEREKPNLIYSREELTLKKEIDIPKKIEKETEIVPKALRDKDSPMTFVDKS